MAESAATSNAQPVIHVKDLHKNYRMGAETIRGECQEFRVRTTLG